MDYAANQSQEIPSLLEALERETHQKVLQPRMMSGPLQGRFLSLISHLIRPNSILEIGTFTGYATLCLAEGLTETGILHTIDINEELASLQSRFFNKSPYAHQIHQHLGNALDIIPTLTGPFDLVFIDADKVNYSTYFDLLIGKMRPGGLLLSDNVLWSGKVLERADEKDISTLALQAYNKKLGQDPRVQTVLLPLRDGLSLSRVL
ncbi:MAG: O-methyltransferase [Flavobacteriaceae bacterium]